MEKASEEIETLVFNVPLPGADATLLDATRWRESVVPLCLVRIRLQRNGQEREIKSRLDLGKRWFIDQVVGDDEATALLRLWTADICDAILRRLADRDPGPTQPPNCS